MLIANKEKRQNPIPRERRTVGTSSPRRKLFDSTSNHMSIVDLPGLLIASKERTRAQRGERSHGISLHATWTTEF
ncbi:hypothetical protein AXF42_Ash015963 [Apostasia shenzhenica]|uniref:Uncharacterized protein n=1 Tax=Apostasia shenzhenica TaxID=1088818 RepID=A0A2I0AWH9_9ASPA|nr:hypothetical protein AXF42_Ash015963 [Apostasia shenzhenica]